MVDLEPRVVAEDRREDAGGALLEGAGRLLHLVILRVNREVRPRIARTVPLRPLPPAAAATLAVLLVAGALASAAGAPRDPDEHAYPVGEIVALKTGSGTLLNEYDWGGFLIYRVPERKVFVDGRLFPYFPAVLTEYRDAVELRPDWKDVLVKYDVREALLMPAKPLAVMTPIKARTGKKRRMKISSRSILHVGSAPGEGHDQS